MSRQVFGRHRSKARPIQRSTDRKRREPVNSISKEHSMRRHLWRTGLTLVLLSIGAAASGQTVDTRLGKLDLESGYPSKAAIDKLYDELDFQRATQAYIWALPAVGFHG